MNTKVLEYLMKAVECGSITRAAEQLFISQPTLTKNIQSLEKEYGIQILRRTPQGVELTDEGKDFVYYAKGVLAATNALELNFSTENRQACARLFIAAQRFDFVHDLILKTYQQTEEKNVHCSLIETDRNSVVSMVLEGAADLGLLICSNYDGKSFLWKKEADQIELHHIATDGSYVCVGPQSPFFGRREVTFEELRECPTIALDMKNTIEQSTYVDNRKSNLNKNTAFFFNSVSVCRHFLLHTDVILYINKWSIGCFQDPNIQILPVKEGKGEPVLNELMWCKRAGEPLTQGDRHFLRNLYRYFGLPMRNF